ncbi:MAG: hydrolase [Bacteroidota bacterium]
MMEKINEINNLIIPQNTKTIAIDFDGTIVEDCYPKIGEPKIFAFETLQHLQKDGHRLILWTYREGKELEEAVSFCKKNKIVFYAVNKNYPEEVYSESNPRKIIADIYIDDRNIGGFFGWGKIYQLINPQKDSQLKVKKRSIFDFLKK